jgi:DNA-binding beta-propeller fold protein YncE
MVAALMVPAAACAGSSAMHSAAPSSGGSSTASSAPVPPPTPADQSRPRPQRLALVTTELRGQLVVMRLPGGRVLRRITVAPDPKTVAAAPGGPVAVVSPGSGAVTVLSRGLGRVHVFHQFRSPQLAAFTPDGEYLLVTDAGAGTLTVIELADMKVVGSVVVGAGAHHLAVSPDDRRVWVALGETASTIVVVDIADRNRPRVLRRLHPAVAVHDLAFSPDGRSVWVSSATEPVVSVFRAGDGRLLGTVPGGRAPQHVLFDRGRAYVTTGYGSSIEMVDPTTRAVLRRRAMPYGSFNLAATGPWLVVSSVLDGEVTVLRAASLRRVSETAVASVARSVAVLSR